MNYYKPNCTNLELCDKIEKILAFMQSFLIDKKDIECVGVFENYEVYKINDIFSIQLQVDRNEMYLIFMSADNPYNKEKIDYENLICLESENNQKGPYTFFNDDSYNDFIFYNSYKKDKIKIELNGLEFDISTKDYNLLNEDERFQFSTLYENAIVNIVQFVQYFGKYNICFRVWFSKEIEKLYEVLDEKYGIQQYNIS